MLRLEASNLSNFESIGQVVSLSWHGWCWQGWSCGLWYIKTKSVADILPTNRPSNCHCSLDLPICLYCRSIWLCSLLQQKYISQIESFSVICFWPPDLDGCRIWEAAWPECGRPFFLSLPQKVGPWWIPPLTTVTTTNYQIVNLHCLPESKQQKTA